MYKGQNIEKNPCWGWQEEDVEGGELQEQQGTKYGLPQGVC